MDKWVLLMSCPLLFSGPRSCPCTSDAFTGTQRAAVVDPLLTSLTVFGAIVVGKFRGQGKVNAYLRYYIGLLYTYGQEGILALRLSFIVPI